MDDVFLCIFTVIKISLFMEKQSNIFCQTFPIFPLLLMPLSGDVFE